MIFRRALAVWAVLALLPVGLQAQERGAVYIGGGGGADFRSTSDLRAPGVSAKADYSTGWAAMGTVGYRLEAGPRFELEVAYRRNSVGSLTNPSAPLTASTSADSYNLSGMANVLYDMRTPIGITPYIGAGIGLAHVDADDLGSDTQFAYQFIGGASYEMTRNIDMFVDYRFFGTPNVELDDLGTRFRASNTHHTVMAGLRYSFWPARVQQATYQEPPAPPQPVAQPLPPRDPPPRPAAAAATAEARPAQIPRNYLVFFEFDRATITREAADIIRTAAENARHGNVARLMVTGHTDRAGPASYNMGLSERRANAVVRELANHGVSRNDVTVRARGETEPLVPTPDGVAEPQNRRVEIVLD